jgi:SAM-dependent methyltransferase
MSFKDLFSAQSSDYARFRPTYPDALFVWLASVAAGRDCAVDVATGSGQAALLLAQHFARVVALDASAAQIAAASPHPQVRYGVAQAENTGLAASSADLLTAAQAFHWFDQAAFFAEAARLLRPGGVLALWCYGLPHITPEVDAVVQHLYGDLLGSYWDPERRLVEEGYRSVTFPFQPLDVPSFAMTAEWEFDGLVGYLGTWSALKAFVRARGGDPLAALAPDLARAWGDSRARLVRWPLAVHARRR